MGILSGRSIGARCSPKPAPIPVGDLIGTPLRAQCFTKYTFFETVGLGPEMDYLSPSYDLLNKGHFFTRSWVSRNKMTRSSILGPASLLDLKASGSVEDLELIQEEDTNPSIDTSLNHEEDDQEIDEPQSDINPITNM
ncbi:hypothetical protein Tco_0712733 [Tanacetum coccineum]